MEVGPASVRINRVGRQTQVWRWGMARVTDDQPKEPDDRAPRGADGDDRTAGAPRIISSEELFAGAREIWIEHEGEMYRLRLTGNRKLYLTK